MYNKKQRDGKLGQKWKSFYRIVETTGPVSYIIKNQLDGSSSRANAGDLMLANVDDWQISKTENNRKLREAAYVIPPQPSESETENEPDSEDNVPLTKLAKKYRQERETSEDEDDIPLKELRKRLKHRKLRQEGNLEAETKEIGLNGDILSDNPSSLSSVPSSDSEQVMER